MSNPSFHYIDSPTVYRIRITGCPSLTWLEAIWGDVILLEECGKSGGRTTFIGEMTDQAALVGCINALFNMGHAIISVSIVDTPAQAGGHEEEAG